MTALPLPRPRLGLDAALVGIDRQLGASPHRRIYRAAACLNHGDGLGLRRELVAGLAEAAALDALDVPLVRALVLPASVALATSPRPPN